jgi:hypothetical protein
MLLPQPVAAQPAELCVQFKRGTSLCSARATAGRSAPAVRPTVVQLNGKQARELPTL